MRYPYDEIDYKLILALRTATDVSEQALVAYHSKRDTRRMALNYALQYADRVTEAASALRAEIKRIKGAEANVKDNGNE